MVAKDPSRSVLDFYVLANRLKSTIRSGLKVWRVSAQRLESVAEHIYGTQMLAIAVISEYKIDLDLAKVVLMLAVNELGETITGDITPWDGATKAEKSKLEIKAVEKVLSKLALGDEVRKLYLEFEQGKTKEAKFCGQIDKLEACLQVKLYDEAGFTDYAAPQKGKLEERRKYLWDKGDRTLGKAWINNELELGFYEGEFLELAKYARDHKLSGS
jgi:putative hydrolase of HD superfamily